MKRIVVGMLLGLLLIGFMSGYSYAAKGCGDVKGERAGHEEGMPLMGQMGHRGMWMMRADHRTWKALSDLGLDEKQKQAIKNIRTAARKETIRKAADIKIAGIELRETLDNDPVDIGAVEAKLKQMESLRTDLHMSRIKAMEEIKATLTPEQRQKFKTNLRKHFRFHGKRAH
jgi:Spy/CpxP family protein refolding chaperone